MLQVVDVHGVATVDENDDFFKVIFGEFQQILLIGRKFERFAVAVARKDLAGQIVVGLGTRSAEDDDRRIVILFKRVAGCRFHFRSRRFLDADAGVTVVSQISADSVVEGHLRFLCLVPLVVECDGRGIEVVIRALKRKLVHAGGIRRRPLLGIVPVGGVAAERVLERDHGPLHLDAHARAEQRDMRTHAEQGDLGLVFRRRGERQYTVVLQKHGTLGALLVPDIDGFLNDGFGITRDAVGIQVFLFGFIRRIERAVVLGNQKFAPRAEKFIDVGTELFHNDRHGHGKGEQERKNIRQPVP